MLGRRSLSLPLNLCELDLGRTLRQNRTRRTASVSREHSNSVMADEEERPVLLRDHYLPSTYNPPSCLQLPNVTVANYEIKSSIIQMLSSFYGLNNEDPYKHIDEFLEICSTIKMHGFSEDALRMRLFPFSLKEKAKHWLKSLEPNVPIGRTNQIRKTIISFSQLEGEQFHETWERLKDLLRKCPHQAIPKWQLVQCFYDGLTEPHRQMVDASCGGTFMMKSENEAWILFDNLSENSMQHASSTSRRTPAPKAPKIENIFEASTPFDVTTKVDALSQKIDQLMADGFALLPFRTSLHGMSPALFAPALLIMSETALRLGNSLSFRQSKLMLLSLDQGMILIPIHITRDGEITQIFHGEGK